MFYHKVGTKNNYTIITIAIRHNKNQEYSIKIFIYIMLPTETLGLEIISHIYDFFISFIEKYYNGRLCKYNYL